MCRVIITKISEETFHSRQYQNLHIFMLIMTLLYIVCPHDTHKLELELECIGLYKVNSSAPSTTRLFITYVYICNSSNLGLVGVRSIDSTYHGDHYALIACYF